MIRAAENSDIEGLLLMAEDMWDESPVYSRVAFIYADMREFLENAISMPHLFCIFVSVDADGLCGMIGGMVNHYLFNSQEYSASDFGFYVRPEKRGGRHFVGLESAYRKWAVQKNAWPVRLGESSAINSKAVDEILVKLGYNRAGSTYILQGDNPNMAASGFFEEVH